MKEIHLLGISQDTITIIFDIVSEIEREASFFLYPNIDKTVEPFMPVKNIGYKLMPLGAGPEKPQRVFFGAASPKNKESIFNSFKKSHHIGQEMFDRIVHPTAYIASSTLLEHGILIEPHVVISSQSAIGFGVFIKRGSLIGHHNTIGAFTDINPGVVISGKVTIGSGCIIGSGTVIRDNITIGKNTTIGIGSVVTKNIPENCVAFGNPCRVVKENG